jgi:hypothetical protein
MTGSGSSSQMMFIAQPQLLRAELPCQRLIAGSLMRKLLLVFAIAYAAVLASCGGSSSKSNGGGGGGGGGPVVKSVVSLAVKPSSAAIAALTQQKFQALATMSDGSTGVDVTNVVKWTSSSPSVATISSSAPTQGLATGANVSTTASTTITATCTGSCVAQSGTPSATATLTVTNATPTAITISAPKTTIGWGEQVQFTAVGKFSDGTTQDITNVSAWSSSQPKNVFVTSSSGLAIGKNLTGSTPAAVTASFRGLLSNSVPVTVDLSNLVSIATRPATPTIANGTTLQFSAVGTFTDGSTRSLGSLASWNSSNTSVATVSSSGVATSVGQGTATITATATGAPSALLNPATLNVENATLQSVSVAPANASIAADTQLDFTAVGTFAGTCSSCPFQQDLTVQQSTTWASSQPAVAKVNSVGIATALAAGTTNISATSSLGASGLAPLTVTSATLVSIQVKPANTFIPPGGTVQYHATGSYSDNSTQDISSSVNWQNPSPDPSIATITNFGLATGQGQGKTTVTATLGGKAGTTSLLVTSSSLTRIDISPTNPKLAEKTAAQLTATGTFSDGSTQDLTTSVNWSSSNKSIATIGAQTGIISGLAPGSSTITATFGSVTGTTTATITNATLTSITISPPSASIALGTSQQFNATGHFSDGTTQSLINANWSSSAPNVAVVSSFGLATSAGVGTTTISATLNGVSPGTATLTVH